MAKCDRPVQTSPVHPVCFRYSGGTSEASNFYRCTVHSDIHTVHSPTDAHLLEL